MLSDSGKPMLTLCVPNFVFGWQQLINVTVLKPASCCTAVNPFLVAALSLLLVIRVCYCGVADSFWIVFLLRVRLSARRQLFVCRKQGKPANLVSFTCARQQEGLGVGRGAWIPLRSSTSQYISPKLRQACIN